MRPADVEDVIGDAIVECLRFAQTSGITDGLFLVIAQRRALDLLRNRKREIQLSAGDQPATAPNREHLEEELFERAIHRYASVRRNVDETRLRALAGRVFEGCSLAEACRESGIPRGSQNRYRKISG
jgi:DNA-directed RNA polymerase specialized sigma24 family protein